MKFWHRLKPNESSRHPSSHIFVDCETRGQKMGVLGMIGKHRLYLGCASYVRIESGKATRTDQVEFTQDMPFWDWVDGHLDKRRPLWVWAHNAGFDFTIADVWRQLKEGRYKHKLLVLDGPPFIARLFTEAGQLVLVDTLNWWRCPLEQLGHAVGIEKMAFPAWSDPAEVWRKYCWRDVEIIQRSVLQLCDLVKREDFGVLRPTAPGQAMQAFRHLCPDRLPVIHAKAEASQLERRCYFGGQCEAFFVGKVRDPGHESLGKEFSATFAPRPEMYGPVYILDTHSLYSWCLHQYAFPRLLVEYVEKCSVKSLAKLVETKLVCAAVKLHVTQGTFPAKRHGKVNYARGTFWTHLCTPELKRALAEETVLDVGQLAWYEPQKMFAPFVEHFWRLRHRYRNAGKEAWADLCKLILNALPGKFGQKEFKWSDDASRPADLEWGQWYEEGPTPGELTVFRGVAGCAQEQGKGGESRESFPAISAHVTAYGRERMLHFRRTAGAGNVLYQYADAIVVTHEGYENLGRAGMCKDEPGFLREKDPPTMTAEIHAPGDYVWGQYEKITGLPRVRLKLGEGRYLVCEFEQLAGVIKRGADGSIIVSEREKVLKRDGHNGRIHADGWCDPVTLDE